LYFAVLPDPCSALGPRSDGQSRFSHIDGWGGVEYEEAIKCPET
jgi:hypothetical protein